MVQVGTLIIDKFTNTVNNNVKPKLLGNGNTSDRNTFAKYLEKIQNRDIVQEPENSKNSRTIGEKTVDNSLPLENTQQRRIERFAKAVNPEKGKSQKLANKKNDKKAELSLSSDKLKKIKVESPIKQKTESMKKRNDNKYNINKKVMQELTLTENSDKEENGKNKILLSDNQNTDISTNLNKVKKNKTVKNISEIEKSATISAENNQSRLEANREWNSLKLNGNLQHSKITRSGRVEIIDNRDNYPDKGKSENLNKIHNKLKESSISASKVQMIQEKNPQIYHMEYDLESGMDDIRGLRSSSRNAAEQLAQKLQGQTGNEIVKQIKLVLNNTNDGEIHLNLKPEHLGRIRLLIKLDDGNLTGRIFVESAAANQAFRSTLTGLQDKLTENGFDTAQFDLSWDQGQNNNPNQWPNDWPNDWEDNSELWNFTLKNTDEIVQDFEVSGGRIDGWFDGHINMIA